MELLSVIKKEYPKAEFTVATCGRQLNHKVWADKKKWCNDLISGGTSDLSSKINLKKAIPQLANNPDDMNNVAKIDEMNKLAEKATDAIHGPLQKIEKIIRKISKNNIEFIDNLPKEILDSIKPMTQTKEKSYCLFKENNECNFTKTIRFSGCLHQGPQWKY
jgi:hypothetical protein